MMGIYRSLILSNPYFSHLCNKQNLKTSGLDVHKATTFCAIYGEEIYSSVKYISTMPVISVAETGGDMSAFASSGKFTEWAGLRSRNDASAEKFKSTATTKDNKHLRAIIVQVAWAASRTKSSFFMDKFMN